MNVVLDHVPYTQRSIVGDITTEGTSDALSLSCAECLLCVSDPGGEAALSMQYQARYCSKDGPIFISLSLPTL